jgi:hypothetical protein
MLNGITLRKISAEDIPRIVEIQESTTEKKVPRLQAQSIEAQLRESEKNKNNLLHRGDKESGTENRFSS